MNTKQDNNRISNFAGWARSWVYQLLVRPARSIGNMGITPNTLTLASFVLNILAALLIVVRQWQVAGCIILLSGILDILDGAVAHETSQETPFGAFLDSVLDQYGEIAILMSLLSQYLPAQAYVEVILIILIVIGTVLTSYVRARAGWLGIECRVGILTHVERVLIITLGLITKQVILALWLLAVLSNLTVLQRIVYVWRSTRNMSSTIINSRS
jgi:CDP-diacylglycerol--glycerol-3-phosphate 3-phosphatidyltransferase